MAGKNDIKAGRAYVELLVKDGLFAAGLKKAQARLRAFGQAMTMQGAAVTAAGAAIVAPFAAATRSFLSTGDWLDKMSQRTGVSVEALSEMRHAAEQSGTQLDVLENAVRKMQKTLVDAAEGGKTSGAWLARLGLSARQLSALAPEEQFEAIARALNGIADPTTKAAAALALFGKSGTQLLPMLGDFDALRAEARALGIVMSGEAARDAAQLNDAMANVTKSVKHLGLTVGAALAEPLLRATRLVQRIVTAALAWTKENATLARAIAAVGAATVVLGAGLTALGVAALGASAVLGGIVAVLGAITSPVALVVGGLAAAAAAAVKFTDVGRRAAGVVGESFARLAAIVRDTLGGIVAAFESGDIALAGQIAMKTLELAWRQGMAAVADAADALLAHVGTSLEGMQHGWIDAVAAIETAWVESIGVLSDAWTAFRTLVMQGFTQIAGRALSLGMRLSQLLGNDSTAARLLKGVAIAGVESGRENISGALAEERNRRLNAAAAARAQRHEQIAAARAAGHAGIAAGGGDGRGGDVARLQNELADLIGAARRQRADAGGVADAGAEGGAGGGLGGALAALAKARESFATFSAAGLVAQGGAGASPVAEIVRELKRARREAAEREKNEERRQRALLARGVFQA